MASNFAKSSVRGSVVSVVAMVLCAMVFCGLSCVNDVHAEAKQSTLTVDMTQGILAISLTPSGDGTFGKSSDSTIGIRTDNYTGYSMSIVSPGSTSLVNAGGDEVESINEAINESTFSSNTAYNNKWGYVPSQYITNNTVVSNTDYLPAPSSEGDLLAKTNAANSVNDTYTLSFGTRVDHQLPPGTYQYTFILQIVANPIVYNITYDENTTETVSNMPVPNPQPTTIDGGTPVEDSYATISDATPVQNEKKFAGWCDVATTTDVASGDDVCSGTTYHPGDRILVDQTAGPNITLHAIWVETLFPVVWNQMGACTFNGATNDNITGSECEDYWDVKFIDTGIPLYNQANYEKDFEIHFTIVHYDPSEQVDYYGSEDNSQQTFANDKLSSTAGDKKAPGVTIRRSSGTSLDFNSKYGNSQENDVIPAAGVQDVSMFRLDNKIYYSVNNGPLVFIQEIKNFNQQFGLTTWFGGYPRDNCTGDLGPCTSAKRIPQATLSNMYIRLGEYSDDDIHEITFKANDGTSTDVASYLIKDGSALTLPAEPTYADHIFDGWFTAQSGGTEVDTSTVPDASADYYAHWLSTVKLAQIENDSIELEPNDTETIVVTNSAELEPYTFSSNYTHIATVDANTGEVTAVGPGIATITMTGTISGETKTITVTVEGTTYNVTFDAQGGSSVEPVVVGDGLTIDPLPTSHLAGYELEGWYTEPNGGGTQLTVSTIFTSTTPTYYYANWERVAYVCRPAATLHTETCSRSTGGCRGAGYASGATITYGSLVQPNATALVAGNAMTCDINADGSFDEENERFYYFANNGDNAALIYHKNTSNAEDTYSDGLTLLPTSNTTGWTNPHLVTYGTGDFEGKVARFMSYNEAFTACGNSTSGLGSNGKCLYMLEKSNFAQTNIRDGYWLGSSNNARVQTLSRSITTGSGVNGVRPVIEVPIDLVSLETVEALNITFDPHNETSSTTIVIAEGDQIGTRLPANPTYADHLFQGWFTAVTGGTQISASTVPSGDTTYHAQWLKTVALAELSSNSLAIEPNETATINVTNSAELEQYTFSSSNTSIATVDSTTGVVTGVAKGSTTVVMTGTTSGATKTINVNVDSFLPVTQAIISNSDLTVPVGEHITVVVSNAADLEPYTFSSADDSIASVDALTGVITGVSEGTVNIIMTGAQTGLTKNLEVDVVVAPSITHTVTFEPNEGSFNDPSDASKSVADNTALGAMPTPTRANYMFFGWYKDDNTFYQEVYPEEVINSDVTYYAKWVENTSSFPIEFSEINECNFTGTQVTGTYCSHTSASNYYIDTAKQLFTAANYYKDFEIGFNINEYVVANQIPGSDNASGKQATFVNSKAEDSTNNFPGFVLRRNTTNLQLTSRWKGDGSSAAVTINTVPHSIKISRKKEEATPGNVTYKLYYTVDGVENMYQNITNKTYFPFDTAVWFGGAVDADGTSPMRPLVGKLTDMYVKIGVQSDYVITFDANHGSLQSGEESRSITIGDPVGTLPVPTPPDSDFTFLGWFDESVTPNVQVTSTTIPTSNKTYVAHYQYQSSDEPVIFDVSNKATRDYNTLINTWQQSPINISTFNEASPINSSTWGDTSELSEANFWTGLKNNFQSNNCLVPSYKDTATTTPNPSNWSSGSVDCGKPSAYDTKIGAALNVYLNNSQGELVSYADASNGVIHNMIPGQTYYWERADDSTVYGYVSAISDTNYHTRWVDTGIIRNTRDLGGLPVTYTDGNNQTVNGTLAYGRLFRGEKLWNAPATELTKLGINKEYDVGDPSEYSGNTKLPDYVNNQVIHYNFDYNTGDEDNNTSNYMRAWLAVTHIMQDITDTNNPKNIYFHCRIGSDRTGTVAYLLEGLLGVPDEARYEEYELTHLSGQWDRTRYYKQKSNTNNLKFVFMMDYVKTNADIYNWYMKNPNADASLIQSFRSAMVSSGTGNNSSSSSSSNSPSNSTSNSPSYSPLNSSVSNYQDTDNSDDESVDTNSNPTNNDGFAEPLGANESVISPESGFDNGLAIAAATAIAGGGAIAYGAYKLNSDSKES